MAISQRLELRQGQSLVMTPQLQQAIKLLQLSNLELTAYVEQELERNPLLERDESAPVGEAAEPEAAPDTAPAAETLDVALSHDDFSRADDMDAGRGDLYGEEAPSRATG
ncbi:MAG: RNA polymerase sigma-54 factor, partial [Alphaproteobacteria bacterium]|nr:RNA polymerase sigma-54 factor [Alphaproteobacteria bacterium]